MGGRRSTCRASASGCCPQVLFADALECSSSTRSSDKESENAPDYGVECDAIESPTTKVRVKGVYAASPYRPKSKPTVEVKAFGTTVRALKQEARKPRVWMMICCPFRIQLAISREEVTEFQNDNYSDKNFILFCAF